MALSITTSHAFVSAVADDADATHIQPSHWNAGHTVAMTLANSRVVGRNTSGSGAAEEVTASQLLDWVTNTNGVLLTRTGGSWAALANVTTDNGDVVFAENASPVAPSAGSKIFGSSSGGRQMPAAIGPAGSKMLLQPFIAQRNMSLWIPSSPGATTFTALGSTATSVTGTLTGRALATTNSLTGSKRIGVVSAAGAGSVAGLRCTTTQFWLGNAAHAGGFHITWRFAVSDAVIVSTGRMFAGLQSSASAPTDVNPSTLTNIIGVGCEASDTTLRIYSAGGVAQPGSSLSASFPVNAATNTDVYEFSLYAAPNASSVTYQLIRLNTGDTASGTISSNLPSSTTFLTQQLYRANGGTASAVGIDMLGFYGETEL